MEIIEDLLPSSLPNVPYHPMRPKYITIHNTGNSNKGADAKSHARYLGNGAGGRSASWHYTVDDKTIIQHLPDNRSGWHCTDGNGPGNRSSIGIEICENGDGDMKKAEENAIELIRFLMMKHRIPIENVVPHRKWYPAKYCPRKILPRWDEFIKDIKGETKVCEEKPKEQVKVIIETNDVNAEKIAADFKKRGYKVTIE
jgi:N-acetylmuramoyl-L-alanine amidase